MWPRDCCAKFATGLNIKISHSSKSMSDKAVLFPKWLSHEEIILAKGQLDHLYTFWTMSIMTFSLLSNSLHHPLCLKYNGVRNIVWIKSFLRFLLKTLSLVQKKMIPHIKAHLFYKKRFWILNWNLKWNFGWLTQKTLVSNIVVRLSYRRTLQS